VRVPFADHSLIPIPSSNITNTTNEIDYLFLSDIFATGCTALDYSGFEAGDTVAVFGAGPVGLLSTYSAILRGASAVYVVDSIPQRLQLVESIGAIPVSLNGTNFTAAEQILQYEPGGATRSIDCVGYKAVNRELETQSNVIILDMVAVTAMRGGMVTVGIFAAPGESDGTPLGNSTSPNIQFPIADFLYQRTYISSWTCRSEACGTALDAVCCYWKGDTEIYC
jgi:threonine dehydrogenase-like Zn-dependent dehydrogenase